MSPWNDPIPLTRAWCLWEIMCALDSEEVEFLVRVPPSQVAGFHTGLIASFDSAMSALVQTQAEKAEAWNPKDKVCERQPHTPFTSMKFGPLLAGCAALIGDQNVAQPPIAFLCIAVAIRVSGCT